MTLTFDAYQARCAGTAVYPEKGTGSLLALAYVGLGLGEVGEVQAKVLEHPDGSTRRTEVLLELGDVLWFTAQVATELDQSLSAIAAERTAGAAVGMTMDEFAAAVPATTDLEGAALELAVAGDVQGLISKILRGDPAAAMPAHREKIAAGLGAVLVAAARVAGAAGSTLGAVGQGNLDKLADRARRGVLKGAGDHR